MPGSIEAAELDPVEHGDHGDEDQDGDDGGHVNLPDDRPALASSGGDGKRTRRTLP
jgi:hypothetical protein